MKKILALLVIMSMLISMSVMIPSAVDMEGDWTTYRNIDEYYEPDPETGEEPPYRAAAGYKYTDEGFTTVPADYTDTTPFMKVETKDKHNLKDGLYLKFRVDDFSYKGEDGASDEWIAITFSTMQNYCRTAAGADVSTCISLRGAGDGTATSDNVPYTIDVDENGDEIYTLEIEWTGSEYAMTICGNPLATKLGDSLNSALEKIDSNGDFYVGVAFHTNVKNGTASMTILKYGTSEEDATTPQGSDSKEPEENINIVADLMDPTAIGENQPGVFWDASKCDAPVGVGFTAEARGDNSFRITANANSYFINWQVRNNISYAVEDFPVFAMMLKDYWASGSLWYNCGDIMGPTDGYHVGYSVYDGIYFEGEEFEDYTLVYVDLTGMCSGRINSFRVDTTQMDLDNPEYDVCYVGCFRSVEEAEAYGAAYLGAGVATEETKEPTEDPSEEPSEELTEAPTQPSVENPGETDTQPTATTDPAQGDSGCSSVIGSAAVILTAVAAAFVLKKKD